MDEKGLTLYKHSVQARKPELWTFSGINSRQDYVSAAIEHEVGESFRSYASELGTGTDYDDSHNVLSLDAEEKLDREAYEYANQTIDPGFLKSRQVCAMFLAPKTTTEPVEKDQLDFVIYWSPHDVVPNQGLFRPNRLRYWRKWGLVYPVLVDHDLRDFLSDGNHVIKRQRAGTYGQNPGRRKWIRTPTVAPNPLTTIKDWCANANLDVVVVAHSQGANIAMSVLNRGFT